MGISSILRCFLRDSVYAPHLTSFSQQRKSGRVRVDDV